MPKLCVSRQRTEAHLVCGCVGVKMALLRSIQSFVAKIVGGLAAAAATATNVRVGLNESYVGAVTQNENGYEIESNAMISSSLSL